MKLVANSPENDVLPNFKILQNWAGVLCIRISMIVNSPEMCQLRTSHRTASITFVKRFVVQYV